MRKIKIGKADNGVMTLLARNYSKLKNLCGYRDYGCFCSKSYEDIFQDTVIYVSQDKRAVGMPEDELVNYFCFRFKMILFQTINDNKELKEIAYADYRKNEGKTTLAEDIHHIQSFMQTEDRWERMALAYDIGNLMSLCKKHHQMIHNQKHSGV